ncbi:MAG: gfo/Idh/MocA family oxidoreductase [Segetibacter sp.]|nr:gfo/Idh/MocA family oxidoreductase [Segetibacter sp.]
MKNNRRNFLKLTSLTGLGLAGGVMKGLAHETDNGFLSANPADRFNMSGYAAPKIENVRVGFIGLGQRGPTHLTNMTKLSGVSIVGLCDIRQEKVLEAQKLIEKSGQKPTLYSGGKDAWKKLCDRKDVDLIYIATPWALHVPMAVYAMEQGKHVAIEVPAAKTIDECWQLVKTSEKTRKHCMMLENCCYDFFELMTLNMARQGFFGDIIHTEGAYIHYLVDLNFKKDGYYDMWRLKENIGRNGNLYPTHGLGPVCQVMNINRGDKMDYLVSMSSIDNMMEPEAEKLAAKDDFYKQFVHKPYRGNMNTTVIRTNKGRTIMIQHDVSSPNIYSRIHKISGSKGSALKYPTPRIASSHEKWLSDEEFKSLEEKYQPAIVKKVGELAKQVGGHGGMDFLMDWRLIDCLRNGLPLDQDVYDAALWSAIAPLSEKSVASRSSSVDVPDFTGGSWIQNKQVDISLERGGNTLVKL